MTPDDSPASSAATGDAPAPLAFCLATALLVAELLLPRPAPADGAGAGRLVPAILRNVPQRLERLFGPATGIRPGDRRDERQLLFDPAPWRRLWPDLPEEAEFGIVLGPGGEPRAIWLDVNALVREARRGVSEEFRFGKEDAFAFFRRIFGRTPTRWQALELPQGGGGHEGFRDHRLCMDPGLAIRFSRTRLGEEWIRLAGEERCR